MVVVIRHKPRREKKSWKEKSAGGVLGSAMSDRGSEGLPYWLGCYVTTAFVRLFAHIKILCLMCYVLCMYCVYVWYFMYFVLRMHPLSLIVASSSMSHLIFSSSHPHLHATAAHKSNW